MGGIFGSASRGDAVPDVFYGTDYHSHLGTRRGGMVVHGEAGFKRNIHDITNAPFRTKFEEDLPKHRGHLGHRRHQRLRGPAADDPLAPRHLRDRHRRTDRATWTRSRPGS